MRGIHFVVIAFIVAAIASPSAKAAVLQPTVTIGMPFSGKWAYNVTVHPDGNGKYNDKTSSHPSVHSTDAMTGRLWGDWATDLYAPAGTAVRLHITTSSGRLGLAWDVAHGSCAGSTVVRVSVNGQFIGWVYFTHLYEPVNSGPLKNGMLLGWVANPLKDGGCNPGPHVHIELKNAQAGTHACWVDHGYPGTSVVEGGAIGELGTGKTAKRQACSSTSASTAATTVKQAAPTPKTPPAPQPISYSGTVNVDNYNYGVSIVLERPLNVPELITSDREDALLGPSGMFRVTIANLTPGQQAPLFNQGGGGFGVSAIYTVPARLAGRQKQLYERRLIDGKYISIGNEYIYGQQPVGNGFDPLYLAPNGRYSPTPAQVIEDSPGNWTEADELEWPVPRNDWPAWQRLVSRPPTYVVLWSENAFGLNDQYCLLMWDGNGVGLNMHNYAIPSCGP